MAGGVLLSLLYNLRLQFFAVAGLRFIWRKDGTWIYTDLRGARRNVSYWKAVWVSPQLILIRLRPDQGRRWVTLVLCGDSVSAELHRELRVRLYLRGAHSCQGSKW